MSNPTCTSEFRSVLRVVHRESKQLGRLPLHSPLHYVWDLALPSCRKICRSPGGLTQHFNLKHKHHDKFGKWDKSLRRARHPLVDGQCTILSGLRYPQHLLAAGTPCDKEGYDLESGTLPPLQTVDNLPDWGSFTSQVQFETADFLFKKAEMSQGDVDILMQLWASTTADHCAPFENHQEMLTA